MYGLKNIMEDAVFSKIKELQPHINCCTCEKCIIDVASYALNRLTPSLNLRKILMLLLRY